MIISETIIASLMKIDDQLLTQPSECWSYGYDNSRQHHLPDAVAFPKSHEQVLKLIQCCFEHDIPVIARGRGTGTTGATVPIHGGLVLSLEKMTRCIEVNATNRLMIVEPGITNQQVQDIAGKHGCFWPPDPTSGQFCTIGGNLAYNSAGPRAVKYGTPRENVLGLKAVTGDGREIRTGVFTTKGVVGYDLTRLLIGSEGTLAVITEATLKITPQAEAKATLMAVYQSIHGAAQAISSIMSQSVIPCALEFIDHNAIKMIQHYSPGILPVAAGAILMIEVDGSANAIQYDVEAIKKAANNATLINIQVAQTAEEVSQLWRARKALSPALRKIAPKKINEDVVVPVTRIPDLIAGLEKLAEHYQIQIVNFGHAGNGNIHVNLLINPDDPDEMERAKQCLEQVFDLVLKLQGSISGEHGIGLEKQPYIDRELNPVALEIMKKIKTQFDPKGILNPGKIFP